MNIKLLTITALATVIIIIAAIPQKPTLQYHYDTVTATCVITNACISIPK